MIPNTPLMLMVQIVASACIGLLIGLERQWAHKEAGIRSFTIAALLGTLSWMVSPLLASIQFSSILIILLLVNVFSMWRHQSLEITTSLALTATNILGIIIGTGNFFLAITSGLVITALLTCKPEFVTLSGRLSITELRSILLLGFITAVVYPLLPHTDLDPWHIVNLGTIWLTIVIVSSLNFVNYILLRRFGSRGVDYSVALGGLVNSAATAALLGQEAKQGAVSARDAPGHLLLAALAMLLRDSLLLCLFLLPQWPLTGVAPLIVFVSMTVTAGLLTFSVKRTCRGRLQPPLPQRFLTSPLALRSVGGFGLLFTFLFVLSGLAKQFFGASGLLFVVLGGALVSTASSSVLLGQQLARGAISGVIAASAMWVVALIGLMENAIIFWVASRQSAPVGRLFLFYIPILLTGGLVVALVSLIK